MPMKGKWAQGIQPRNFAWILKDKLAICERPGGMRTASPSAGSTTVVFSILHGNHSDYDSPAIPITVTP